ncbi:hypothetical protein E0698_01040 [Paenibacillus sp. 23TSA30-6]|nr:hypothetical protein [Paenibacillus sp. 23TSA30-6]
MMADKNIVFSPDEKAVALKSTKDLFFAAKQLHDWINTDSLSQEMARILPSLVESHFADISKLLNYESVLTREKEERHRLIREANGRIRELERQMGESKPVDGLKEQLRHLADTVSDWWNNYGFHHVSDEVFTENGHYKARFCFMLDYISTFTDTPVTDKKNRKERLQELKEEGYDIIYEDGDRSPKLIDNDNNRQRLIGLIKGRFPSAEIVRTRNYNSRRSGVYTFRDVEVYIYNLHDIPVSQGEDGNEVF